MADSDPIETSAPRKNSRSPYRARQNEGRRVWGRVRHDTEEIEARQEAMIQRQLRESESEAAARLANVVSMNEEQADQQWHMAGNLGRQAHLAEMASQGLHSASASAVDGVGPGSGFTQGAVGVAAAALANAATPQYSSMSQPTLHQPPFPGAGHVLGPPQSQHAQGNRPNKRPAPDADSPEHTPIDLDDVLKSIPLSKDPVLI